MQGLEIIHKGDTMKKYFLFIAFAALMITGCNHPVADSSKLSIESMQEDTPSAAGSSTLNSSQESQTDISESSSQSGTTDVTLPWI